MEQFPLTGNYIHVHRGAKKPATEEVLTDLYQGILAQEVNNQASFPGTGFVLCGDATKKVAEQGVTRKVAITDFDILNVWDRTYTDWNGKSHWDVVAVIGYYGGIRVYPQGAQAIDAGSAGISLEEFKIKIKTKSLGPLTTFDLEVES